MSPLTPIHVPHTSSNQWVGVGLRSSHYDAFLNDRPAIPWLEVITENYLTPGGRNMHVLESLRAQYPIALHGVSMSIGSTDPLNRVYLEKLKTLAEQIDPLFVSDHLCWSSVGGKYGHDLWPLPYNPETRDHVVSRITQVQEFLKRPILIENVSAYITYAHSTMSEWEFLSDVVSRSGCGLLLDINNIFVCSRHENYDPKKYIDAIPHAAVREIHLAGPRMVGHLLVDTHDGPVWPEVWELYRYFVERHGPRHTLIEWDDDIPAFPVLAAEAAHAEAIIAKIAHAEGARV